MKTIVDWISHKLVYCISYKYVYESVYGDIIVSLEQVHIIHIESIINCPLKSAQKVQLAHLPWLQLTMLL